MPNYSRDPSEREPLDSSRLPRDSPSRRPLNSNYDYSSPGSPSPFSDSRQYQGSPRGSYIHGREQGPYDYQGGNYRSEDAPPPPRHGDNSYYIRGPPAHGEDMGYRYATHGRQYDNPEAHEISDFAPGAVSNVSYSMSDRHPREHGGDAARGSNLPPPPSRTAHGNGPYQGGGGSYMYDGYSSRAGSSPMRSQASSINNFGYATENYADDPYQGFSSSSRSVDRRLGEVNPNDIEDDGDDGLHYPRGYSQRNSMLSSANNSDRGTRSAVGAAAAVGGAAAAGGAMGGLLSRNRDGGPEYNLADGTEKKARKDGMSKRKKWAIILGITFILLAAVIGGLVGGLIASSKQGGKTGGNGGDSAKEDQKKNGDLDINSDEIKKLMNNPDLHKVFPGMDYTPLKTQYPDCIGDPPSQNNITRDMAVLSQLTNKVRLYGTDCNQTQMVIHAIDQLNLKDDMKIWLGVWQDDNKTTNARQLKQMWTVLEDYGDEPFEGLIVANEILFRKEMSITSLGNLLDDVRKKLKKMGLSLPVATSDLGDDWTSALGDASDYIMANIHPFFAGVPAKEAASWTISFWENNNKPMFKSDKSKNIISETGWPTGGGTNCGSDTVTTCSDGSVAGIDELNQFMDDFVCPALKNGTNYFWFSAFDEPWKIQYNEKGKNWEDKWGLMDVDRNLKKGVKIPDCSGDTI